MTAANNASASTGRPPTAATAATATATDGTRIAYRLAPAAAEKPRIALVHSLAMDAGFWAPVAQALSGQASLLMIDCRGHGASDKPAGPYSAAQFAADLRSVFDAVGWPPATVAGASMGGCVALQFAATYPQYTQGLGLIDTTAWYGPNAPADWDARAAKAVEGGLAAMVDFQTTRWFSDGFRAANPQQVKASVDTFLRNDVKAFAATCRMLGAFDGRELLAKITVPTAVVVGEEDYAAPVAMAQALQGGIAGSTLSVIPGTRHLTPLEVPELIAAQLLQLATQAHTGAAAH